MIFEISYIIHTLLSALHPCWLFKI